jgi:HAMP domain-containing protein
LIVLAGLVAVLAFAGLCLLIWTRIERRARETRRLRARLDARDRLIGQLRERAYQHRDLEPDSTLAIIVADEISKFIQQEIR